MTKSNPRDCPRDESPMSEAECRPEGRTSFLHQAARFSVFVPMTLLLVSPVSTLSPFHLGAFYLLDSLAFALGMVAVIGGIRRGAAKTVRLAVLGVVLSAFPFIVFLCCIPR